VTDKYRDSHVPPKLRRQAIDLCTGITGCLAQTPRLGLPALILLYAGIDGMAWSSLPEGRDNVTGEDFQRWAKTYLLPDSGLECTEADLWAARCGLVHSQIMDSKFARKGGARHLWYHLGPGNLFLIPIGEQSKALPVTISIDQLFAVFRRGIERFFEQIENDAALEEIVFSRERRYYDEVRCIGKPGQDGSEVQTIPTVFL